MQNIRPNFESKIDVVVGRAACKKHNKGVDAYCYSIFAGERVYVGVCGDRIAQVFNGRINAKSVGNKRPKAA